MLGGVGAPVGLFVCPLSGLTGPNVCACECACAVRMRACVRACVCVCVCRVVFTACPRVQQGAAWKAEAQEPTTRRCADCRFSVFRECKGCLCCSATDIRVYSLSLLCPCDPVYARVVLCRRLAVWLGAALGCAAAEPRRGHGPAGGSDTPLP